MSKIRVTFICKKTKNVLVKTFELKYLKVRHVQLAILFLIFNLAVINTPAAANM